MSPDQLLEQAWNEYYIANGNIPEPLVSAFLTEEWNGPNRVARLVELVQVDQEFRWNPRQDLPNPVERKDVATYVAEWPELKAPEIVTLLLHLEFKFGVGNEAANQHTRNQLEQLLEIKVEWPKQNDLPEPPKDAPHILGYHIIRKLGGGRQGSVWLARRGNGPEVALKVIGANTLIDSSRFGQEITALKAITDAGRTTNIVQIIEQQLEHTPCFFVMEYCREGSLAKLLKERERPLAPVEAAKLLKLVASGLHHAHTIHDTRDTKAGSSDSTEAGTRFLGIIHRDIKPGNILLVAAEGDSFPKLCDDPSRQYQPKLGDFGMVKFRSGKQGLTETGETLGTPSYMSPEQANGESDKVEPTADIYSLGAVLYECLTGQPPFNTADPLQTIQLVSNADIDPVDPKKLNPAIPRDLAVICMKCLRKQPDKRYGSAKDLADDLDRFVKGEPIHARPISVREKVLRWCRRHPASVVTVLGVLLAVGVTWWFLNREARSQTIAEDQRKERVAIARSEFAISEKLRDESRTATRRYSQQLISQSLASAKRAEGLLRSDDDMMLKARISRLLTELETYERNQRLILRLEEARLRATSVGHETPFDWNNVEQGVLEAFDQYPLDLRREPIEKIVSIFEDQPTRQEVAATFDLLSRVAQNKTDRSRYRSVATLLDPDSNRNQIRIAIEDANIDKLLRLMEKLELRSQPSATLILLGSYLLEAGKYKESESVLRVAQSRFPSDFWVNLQLSACLFRGSPAQPIDALRFCSIALALRGDSPGARSSLAAAFISARRDEDAEREARSALELDPELPEAHNNLAIALMRLYRIKEAEASAKLACEGRPKLAEPKVTLGIVMHRATRYAEAEVLYREALKIKPDAHIARSLLASLLASQNRLIEADSESRLALEKLPTRAEVLVARAHVLIRFKKYTEAIEKLNLALELTPDFIDAKFFLATAIALSETPDPKKGEEICRSELKKNLKNAEGYVALGICLVLQKNRQKEAIEAFQKALEVCPDHPIAYQSLGQVYTELRDWKNAEKHHRRASELLPLWAVTYADLAVALAELGRWEEAEKADRAAIALDDKNPRPFEHLGFVLQTLYRLPEAESALRTAIQLGDKKIDTHFRFLQVLCWLGKFCELPKVCKQLQVKHPRNAESHLQASTYLAVAGEWKLAEEAILEARKLKPDALELRDIHLSLLELAGRYEDAKTMLKELQDSTPKNDPIQKRLSFWSQRLDRKKSLSDKLKALDDGKPSPPAIRDLIELARHAKEMSQNRYLLALRLYKQAFETQPKILNDMGVALRSEAAQVAVEASAGMGDAKELTDKERAEWRQRALDWLKADLAAYKQQLKNTQRDVAVSSRESMDFWRQTPSLVYVRGADYLAKLPESERKLWEEFWEEVNTILAPQTSGK